MSPQVWTMQREEKVFRRKASTIARVTSAGSSLPEEIVSQLEFGTK